MKTVREWFEDIKDATDKEFVMQHLHKGEDRRSTLDNAFFSQFLYYSLCGQHSIAHQICYIADKYAQQ